MNLSWIDDQLIAVFIIAVAPSALALLVLFRLAADAARDPEAEARRASGPDSEGANDQ